MYITWLGQSCFKMQGKDAAVVTDPYYPSTGLRLPRLTADILTVSHAHDDHNNIHAVSGNPFTIQSAGEYEIKKIVIRGIPTWHDPKEGAELGPNIVFAFEFEDIRIVHLGDLGTTLDDSQLEQLGDVDVLMVPVGGTYTMNGKQAAELVSNIEPRIVIPMHYKIPQLKIKLDTADAFCKEMGVKQNGTEEKLRITKKDLPVDETKVVLLSA
ncbi:MAG: MBL fold metallo-hydrolase [Patescibacteria group bacterium]|nr:MBL fold metallo-hydrolase [Patescibacteria group bacterium]MDD5715531.1 MBL fold metallo-hydrolase [Patescibacteria group bacterium]